MVVESTMDSTFPLVGLGLVESIRDSTFHGDFFRKGVPQRKFRPTKPPRGAEAPPQSQPRAPEGSSGETGSQEAVYIICYKCGQPGHVQADCVANPFCVNYNKEGHLSAMCATFAKIQYPFWAGFGGDGWGFICLEVTAEELQKPASNAVNVSLDSGCLSAE
ncbi:hypothetical protein QYE76_053640 [Lolium multiflorum]|uniref:CCHC-type domain-containing protein n=1 Tax=Lolium multiflorum TaxID=4521 RepID=A0AAD8SXM7_LOLMU|nr:hypothetical protein QYE76_053640 [Lolium multiflorum]